jgi:hypothetical protein
MKKVTYAFGETPKEESKGIEFTHHLNGFQGWSTTINKPNDYESISYLGKCNGDGDMFACVSDHNTIVIYKGNLNNGTY